MATAGACSLTPAQAQAYLQHRRESGIGQKQLSADRTALEFIIGDLEKVQAQKPQVLTPRAYSPEQVTLVAGRQTERNALSTALVYRTGLRAHELLTLRRRDEAEPFAHRAWHPDRFQGREGVRYIVTGKGGLAWSKSFSKASTAAPRAAMAYAIAIPRNV